ncbi:Glycine cleavage system H protein 2 mitochondrial [Zea mays]|uniref:Glycine cleavage system H protein 2 mitochondrial n=1 Tax=Zea mays TaxID=4577 RepID=A0A1D6QSD1_MAIZE|nr:Glycine cleavage system H protein 2 mitochondrial [Zea mays]
MVLRPLSRRIRWFRGKVHLFIYLFMFLNTNALSFPW